VGSSGVVVYYYAQANTTHTTYTDGLEVYEFPNNQVSMLTLASRNSVIVFGKRPKYASIICLFFNFSVSCYQIIFSTD
jgi:hypothetical protein